MGNTSLQSRKSESIITGYLPNEEVSPSKYKQRAMMDFNVTDAADCTIKAEIPFFLSNSPTLSPLDSSTRNKAISKLPQASTEKENALVPHVFRWTHGGSHIYVTGTFNNWRERIPLNKSREEFTTIINLPPGTHQFKFIVDNEWKINPDLPTMPDRSGAVNNFLEIGDADEDDFDFEDFVSASAPAKSPPGDSGGYSQTIPKLDGTSKPPPVLPPHLMQVLLNCAPVSQSDPSLLPIPNHVLLNHLYALSISDGVMVLGMTHRYQKNSFPTDTQKFRRLFLRANISK
ncbi:5'-AMP-activated protein kinase subunit beta-1-like [Zophobas morio]|uniref:5'-AMP-activated protein kinase subunit beta-1-like n=1 Tax=Zophobas morio TaxID=2755281 RepID=UPI0030832578